MTARTKPTISENAAHGAPPRFHLLAKPSGSTCNLDCSYCFVAAGAEWAREGSQTPPPPWFEWVAIVSTKLAAEDGFSRELAFRSAPYVSLPCTGRSAGASVPYCANQRAKHSEELAHGAVADELDALALDQVLDRRRARAASGGPRRSSCRARIRWRG